MQGIRRLFSRRNEKGSTILEVLVALFILSSLGIGAWQAVGVSLRLSSRLRDAMLAGSRLIQLDDRIRELAARVLPPYWAPDHIAKIGNGTVSVPYLDGDLSKNFTMSFKKGMLAVGDGVTSTQYPDFQSVTFSPATDKESHSFGIRVEATGKDGKPVVISARFGGAPVGSAVSP